MNFSIVMVGLSALIAIGGMVTVVFYLPKLTTNKQQSHISNTDIDSVKTGAIMIMGAVIALSVYILLFIPVPV